MTTKIYKWENGKKIEVNSIKEARIKPDEPNIIAERYKKERAAADNQKKG